MDIVFLGAGAFGLPSLEALARSGHRVVHVVSQPDRPAGRGKHAQPTAVAAWALERGIGLTRTENVNSAACVGALREMGAGCLVVIAFGQKLSEEVLSAARHRAINLHSSLLPKYRGAAPINWAVINGDKEAGACVIDVTAVMDAGDIFAEARTEVGASETAGELHDRLAELGAPLLPGVLDQLEAGKAERRAQDGRQATRAPKLSREMAWVDFRQDAAAVSARIRGMSPWPGVQVELVEEGGKVRVAATVLKCRAVEGGEHGAEACGLVLGDRTVACGRGRLELLAVQPAGKKAMEAGAFANGYGLRAGARLRSVVAAP
ncbi:MAG TPA: methionyl-tRNA formyltransferase [Phycisphaerae bacterium]|nr:methionyl-tRNA formyltransferase [Phycisphaerae bacterium]